ncbi:MAG: hypothetical protein WCG47_09115 [Dermatophilaceae bacterium]
MEPATLLAAHAARAVAPYLWRALGVAFAVLACVALTVVLTLAGAVTRGSLQEEGQPSVCGSNVSPVLAATGAAGVVSVDGTALDADQVANAAVIAATGRGMGIPDRGVVVALAAAAQESRLRNLDYGDRDSVGLFQQRPSQGWGQVAELMRPDYAATKFYQALQRIPGWEQLPVTEAAQAVQRSAFPTAYAQWETLAVALSGQPAVRQAACAVVAAVGSLFTDAAGTTTALPQNPRGVAEAISWARGQAASASGGWYRRCLAFVAQAYGWSFSGTPYAIDQYTAVMPTQLRHDGDRNPPPGALLFWTTSSRAGHVALYVGGGMVASNDIEVDGQISIVPAADIETRWGATYVGWAPPYFPGGG